MGLRRTMADLGTSPKAGTVVACEMWGGLEKDVIFEWTEHLNVNNTEQQSLSGEALCVRGIEDEQTFSRQRRYVFKVPNPACRAPGPWQLPGVQQGEWAAVRRISPLHRLPTDGVPLVSELTQHVVQLQVVVSQGGLLLQRTPSPVGGVVDRMLGSEGFLKLLYIQQESSMHFYLGLIHK